MRLLRSAGYLALAALPFAYAQVPGLPPFARSLALMAAGSAFATARLLGGSASLPAPACRAGRWAAAWLAWQALSMAWSEPAFRWTAVWGVLNGAATLAVAAGIASDPRSRSGLLFVLSSWGLSLGIFAFNVATGGLPETWIWGAPLHGLPIDHLPFGNRNSAALLVSAMLPPALLGAWGAIRLRRTVPASAWIAASAWLVWMLAVANALGASLGLGVGGALAAGILSGWRPGSRRALTALAFLACLGGAMALGFSVARRPPAPWRLTTSFGLRTLVWESAVRDWASAPWLGRGAGGFALRFPECRSSLYPLSQHATPLARHAYSLPLQTLCDTGLVGLFLAALALRFLLAACRAGPWWPVSAWCVCALLVQSLGGDALVDPLGLACLAVAAGASLRGPPALVPEGPRRPWLAALLGGALLALLAEQGAQVWAFAQAHAHRVLAGELERSGSAEGARREWLAAEARYARASQGGVPSLLDLDARFERGLCLMCLGRPREAMAVYRGLMSRGGPYGNARRAAGLAALRSGKVEVGRLWLEEHLAFDPCDVEARRLLLEQFPGQRARREAEFWALASRLPDTHSMLERGSRWRYEAGDWEGAWRLLLRVLSSCPARLEVRANAVDAGLRSAHPGEALSLARVLDPGSLGTLLADMDLRIAGNPEAREPRGMRALLRLAAGNASGAREDLEAIPRTQTIAPWRDPLAALIEGGKPP